MKQHGEVRSEAQKSDDKFLHSDRSKITKLQVKDIASNSNMTLIEEDFTGWAGCNRLSGEDERQKIDLNKIETHQNKGPNIRPVSFESWVFRSCHHFPRLVVLHTHQQNMLVPILS